MHTVRSHEEIPDESYRKMVLTLMDRQAGREIATAEVFGQYVIHAPSVDDKIRITRYQNEELKHFKLIARLMAELGVDIDAYVRNRQKAGARFTGDQADIGIEDWIDATLFNFMIDRAATFSSVNTPKAATCRWPRRTRRSSRTRKDIRALARSALWRCAGTRRRAPRSSGASGNGSSLRCEFSDGPARLATATASRPASRRATAARSPRRISIRSGP